MLLSKLYKNRKFRFIVTDFAHRMFVETAYYLNDMENMIEHKKHSDNLLKIAENSSEEVRVDSRKGIFRTIRLYNTAFMIASIIMMVLLLREYSFLAQGCDAPVYYTRYTTAEQTYVPPVSRYHVLITNYMAPYTEMMKMFNISMDSWRFSCLMSGIMMTVFAFVIRASLSLAEAGGVVIDNYRHIRITASMITTRIRVLQKDGVSDE